MKSLPFTLFGASVLTAILALPMPALAQQETPPPPPPPHQAQPRSERVAERAASREGSRERADRGAERDRGAAGAGAERARGTDDAGRVRVPPTRSVPAPPVTAVAPPAPRTDSRRDPDPSARVSGEEEQRRAQPRGSRPRGDNPTTGRAVPRDGRYDDGRGRDDGRRGGTVYVPRSYGSYRGRVYNNYYYYPRRWYPYGYGAFGLGYFYYDPYTWYSYDPYYSPRYYGGGYYDSGAGYYTGEVRLQVRPRHAEVYVDGYFAGNVDDFDGMFQGLRLEEGPYRIEIVAPGFEPMEFDVRVQAGRKITYRGDLRPRP